MIGFGVVGCGNWGQNYARILCRIQGACLVACCDADPARLQSMRELYPEVNITEDYRLVLLTPELEAVVIATPPGSHYTLAREALERGKHVLVEKPATLSYRETAELFSLAGERGLVAMVGHILEYHPAIRRIKAYLEAGEVGRVLYLDLARTNLGRVRSDVSVLWDLAVHDLSVLRLLLGRAPKTVTAHGASYLQPGIPDAVFLTLSFPDGVLAQIHVSWLNPRKCRQMVIVGDRKMLTFDDLESAEKIRVYDRGIDYYEGRPFNDFGEFQVSYRFGDVYIPAVSMKEPLREQCLHFLDCIAGRSTPLTGAEDALWVARALELAQRSLDSGSHPQPWDEPGT